jgi:aminopeptidase
MRTPRPYTSAATAERSAARVAASGASALTAAATPYRRGADVVRAQLVIDDGAARLGEVALVDDTSPIQRSGVLFYDTLLDESAASHLAWGDGIPDGHRDYEPARPETLTGLPINHSATHVDFMIGSPELRVTGVRADGSRRVILDGERWAL